MSQQPGLGRIGRRSMHGRGTRTNRRREVAGGSDDDLSGRNLQAVERGGEKRRHICGFLLGRKMELG